MAHVQTDTGIMDDHARIDQPMPSMVSVFTKLALEFPAKSVLFDNAFKLVLNAHKFMCHETDDAGNKPKKGKKGQSPDPAPAPAPAAPEKEQSQPEPAPAAPTPAPAPEQAPAPAPAAPPKEEPAPPAPKEEPKKGESPTEEPKKDVKEDIYSKLDRQSYYSYESTDSYYYTSSYYSKA